MSWKHLIVAFSAAAALAVGVGAQAGPHDAFVLAPIEGVLP